MPGSSRLIWLVGILLVILLISVAANIHYIKLSRHYYREFSRVRLDPLGMAQLESTAEEWPATTDAVRVVMYGDSRAAAWPPPQLDGFVFMNRGANGNTTVQAYERFNRHVVPLRPDIVVIQMGVNDLGVIPTQPTNREQIIAACEENIGRIVAETQTLNATIVLTTIFPLRIPSWNNRLYWSADILTAVTQVNDYILSLQSNNVMVLDAYQLLVDEQGLLKEAYTEDYSHLNENGYQVLNQALIETLQLHHQRSQ